MYRRLTANTTTEAQGILTEALVAIDDELRRRGATSAPLRVTVHYDIDDMGRIDELDVDECLHLPYDGIPPGLQPHNASPRPPRPGLLDRFLNY